MKTPARLKFFVVMLGLTVLTPMAARTDLPTGQKGGLRFLTERLGSLPQTTRPIALRSETVVKECLDSMLVLSTDTMGLVGIDSKLQFEYNPYGQLTFQCMSSTDSETSAMIPEESLVFTYDAKGQMSSDSSYAWDADKKQWILGGYDEFAYDSKGRLSQQVEAFLNGTATYSKTVHAYDETGKLKTQTRFLSVDKEQWMLIDKKEFAYQLNGVLESTTSSTWESYNNTWLFRNKTESVFDGQNRDTLTVSCQWDETTQAWVVKGKVEKFFDAAGRKTREVTYERTQGNTFLTKDSKAEYTFDNNGNILSDNKYGWDEDSLDWRGYTSVAYNYDRNVGGDDLIMPFQLSDFPFYNKLTGATVYLGVNLSEPWFPIASLTCFYSKKELMGLSTTKGSKSSWTYLAETQEIRFDAASRPSALRLYDLQGRCAASYEHLNGSGISLQGLKKGLYLLLLESQGGLERGKVVVE